jgi:hypothetical protein
MRTPSLPVCELSFVFPVAANPKRKFLSIADRQIPDSHNAQVRLVQRYQAVLLLPKRRHDKAFGSFI